MPRCLVAAALTCALTLIAALPAEGRTTFTGQWQCDDRNVVLPLGGMNVELWKRGWDWFPVEITGERIDLRYTNADGTFSMTTPDAGDRYFVRMALRDANGVRLKDWIGINDWSIDSEGRPNDRPVQDLGGLVLGTTSGRSPKCAVWRGVHEADQEYRRLVREAPPHGGTLVQADAPTAGTPFAPGTEIYWPSNYNVSGTPGLDTTARHEFGHTVRHGLDGDLGHFLGDVVDHNYLRHHSACDRTGPGFAFNEGWAEYWARDYGPAPSCPGIPADDFNVEGNVAAALTELETRCARGDRRVMVDVLRSARGAIHSFREFRDRIACPAAPADPPPRAPFVFTTVILDPAVRAAAARAAAARASRIITELRADLRAALRRASDPPACVRTPCLAALRVRTLPAALRTEIALAGVARDAARKSDTAAEVQAWESSAFLPADQRAERERKALTRAAARAAAKGAADLLRTGKPVFARDRSRSTRRLRALVTRRLGGLRRAAASGRLPAGLTLDQTVFERLREVPKRTFPPPPADPGQPTPQPQPGPQPQPQPQPQPGKGSSTLTIDSCPAGTKGTEKMTVSGNLTPPHPGTKITVTFTRPGGASTVVEPTTDNAGKWTAEYSPTPNDPTGQWTVKATWPGDGDTNGSESAVCSFNRDP